MHASSTILLSIFTAALTAAGTVYVIERTGILPARVQAAPEALVPDLHGVTESDARANAATAHVALLVAAREPSPDAKPGTVIRQSIAYAESAERAVPILDYRPDRGADYLSLAGELLRRLSRQDLLEQLDELSTELVPAGASG